MAWSFLTNKTVIGEIYVSWVTCTGWKLWKRYSNHKCRADAVYTGGELFGARANANNLSEDELISAIQYAHLFNRKIYLTVNTLVKDNEIKEKLYNYLLPLYTNGLDAVIVQDIGVLLFIKENFPGMHIHASTQMTIFGNLTVDIWKNLACHELSHQENFL